MRQRKTIVAVGIFFTICLALYAYLGGFKEIKLQVIQEDEYHIVGKYFKGKAENDSMRTIFMEAKSMVEKGIVNGTVVVLYYKDAEQGNSNIECFTGLLLDGGPDHIPSGMEYRKFTCQGVVRARFEGHRVVTPNPSTVRESVQKYVDENSLRLKNLFIEKYFSNNAIEVDYLLE